MKKYDNYDPFVAFKKYAVEADSLEDFCDRYHRSGAYRRDYQIKSGGRKARRGKISARGRRGSRRERGGNANSVDFRRQARRRNKIAFEVKRFSMVAIFRRMAKAVDRQRHIRRAKSP